MAFPTTSVLTSFTGSNENPLSEGGAWSATGVTSGSVRLQRLSNAATSSTTGAATQVWATTYGPDCEAYTTMTTFAAAGKDIGVWARVQNAGNASTATGYGGFYRAGTGFRLFKLTAGGTFTQLSTTNATAATAGDKLGISVVGTAITVWHFAGSWTSRVTATDSTVSGTGQIGLEVDDNVGVADDFGGGTVVVSTVVHDLMMMGIGS